MTDQEDPSTHGWKPGFSVEWIFEPYPEDISELLVDIDELTEAQDLTRDMDMSDDED